ncbi:S-adenosyl-L-methionine-dependent methyltransferase [Aspergillus pseudoustus]|uniref:S-adenosyl-L-methionine-dependent methyltransferase n=1 Tax=Aspergillus pseudoustus TaxID=1810923 RepID=A0ABR4KY99_9EURO
MIETDPLHPQANGTGHFQNGKVPAPSYLAERVIDMSLLSHEEICDRVRQSLVEVSNGLAADKITFTCGSHGISSSVRSQAENALLDAFVSPYRWAVRPFWVGGDEPVLILLSNRQYNIHSPSLGGLLDALSDVETSTPTADMLYRLANELDNRSLKRTVPERANFIEKKLTSVANGDSLLLATLAAEILTFQGTPTIPMKSVMKLQEKAAGPVDMNGYQRHSAATFEKRINVDDYNFFELVHPAYFRQTVALAQLVTEFVKHPFPRAIDVGTGPGTNLLAFLELLPQTDVLAIEPSDVAFKYLTGHFKGEERVTCMQEDFLCAPVEPEWVDYIMSTGASHHFHTDGFLQRSIEWLRPGGYWFIADEMISHFETRKERHLNLLRHHLAYMVPLCFPWPAADMDLWTHSEREFVNDFNSTIPQAKFFADSGNVSEAEILCRELLSRTEGRGFTSQVSDPYLAFWRLQWLELQALVAGLDYDVEQKTHPRHFIKMAESAGLKCVAHKRVYGTVGVTDHCAGTHVMAFQKV